MKTAVGKGGKIHKEGTILKEDAIYQEGKLVVQNVMIIVFSMVFDSVPFFCVVNCRGKGTRRWGGGGGEEGGA
jgi:hypothetical protein